MTTTDDLAQAFQQTAHAHHEAFAAVDGVDPDWPIWYARRLQPKLHEVTGVELTEPEVVALLLDLDAEHRARGEGQPWPRFYADLTAERFVAAPTESLALYHFPACPYCALVRRAIDETGATVELRDITKDPKWWAELVEARGRATVPVLRCEGSDGKVRWMPESRDIVRYLRDRAAKA